MNKVRSQDAIQTERARVREKRKSWRSVGRQLPLGGAPGHEREAHNTGFDHGWARALGEASGIWASVLEHHHLAYIGPTTHTPNYVNCACHWQGRLDVPGGRSYEKAVALWISHVVDEVVRRA